MPTRDPVDLQNANVFLSQSLTGDQKSRLTLALTQAAAVIAETGASLDNAIYDLTIAAAAVGRATQQAPVSLLLCCASVARLCRAPLKCSGL